MITKFAAAFDAPIAVYHYDYFTEEDEIHKKLNKTEHKFKSEKISFHFKKLNPEVSLLRHLQIDIIKTKPSIITTVPPSDCTAIDQPSGAA